jgi:hypothetical protein
MRTQYSDELPKPSLPYHNLTQTNIRFFSLPYEIDSYVLVKFWNFLVLQTLNILKIFYTESEYT